MKGALFGTIIVLFLIPQFALAAWWNPFSWKIFHRTEKSIQATEKRTKEPETNLSATTSAANTNINTVTPQKVVKVSDKPKLISKPEISTAENTKSKEQQTTPSLPISAPATEAKLELSSVRAIPSSRDILIKWNTNIPSSGKLTIWPTSTATGNSVFTTSNVTEHEIQFVSAPAKKYHYIVEVTTSGGQTAASDERETATLTLNDNVAPVINSIDVSRKNGSSLIDVTVNTDEAVKLNFKYYFQYTDDYGVTIATSTDAFSDNSHVSVPMPNGWIPDITTINYIISILDESSNKTETPEQSKKISDLVIKY